MGRFPSAINHATARGNTRSEIFLDDEDRELFPSVLAKPSAPPHSHGLRLERRVVSAYSPRSRCQATHYSPEEQAPKIILS